MKKNNENNIIANENNIITNENIKDNNFDKLLYLYNNKSIPNIIFHGLNNSGKKTLLKKFLILLYKTTENINKYVLNINCSHGKGNIKFIREQLKYFANSTINLNLKCGNNYIFKSIILLNADKLTIDAQSALRRSIEIYSNSTRFFIIVDNKEKLLKPILSRFSDIYCIQNNNSHNNINLSNNNIKKNTLSKIITKDLDFKPTCYELIKLSSELYNNSISGNLLIEYIENNMDDSLDKYKFLILINNYKKDLRNEKLIILFCLHFIYFRNINDLENITFI